MSDDERLPQELKEAVLHQLYAAGDIQSLASCALAHRSLYSASQIYLFRDISLHGPLSATRLLRSLVENPRLGEHVRVLGVEDSDEIQWIVEFEEIAGIFNSVRAIQELYFHPFPVAYGLLPYTLRGALLRAISRSSMRVFSLACVINLPWIIFADMPRLWDLRLSDVHFHEEGIEFIDWSSSPIRLYDLTLDVNGIFFDNFVECTVPTSQRLWGPEILPKKGLWLPPLRNVTPEGRLLPYTLSLLMYGMRWQVGIPDLIAPCANTLESLELGTLTALPEADEPEDWNLHIPLPRLRLLALRHVSITRFDSRHWVWLSRLLADAPNVTHIAVEVQRPIPRLFCLTVLIERLAKVLVGNHATPSLKSLRIISRSLHDASYEYDQQDLEDLEWTLDVFRSNAVDVKITRSLSHGLVQPPLLSLDLLNE
ncbi:uncharacterized protein SCHCODRAFT_01163110 [Schizophyllum commune H4-8]|nr:uncharacterized protein SCHCODRAFT_01163110 [Schizophyllum commune H4-8]KAI5898847.1 hypothetical protein SCHCODRAFT_01163110 [Schizophyllum commune H4-8]